MPAVPFLDVGRLHRTLAAELRDAFEHVLATSDFVGAEASAPFERDLAAAHGLPFAAGCGSGTDALTLALVALGIRPGDEVVVPAMTFVATAEAVVHAGAVPVPADVDPSTLLLTAGAVDAVRSPRTRAVVPVHLYGHVVPFDLLAQWRASGLLVVEDAAQAHLATWRGRPIGSVGHAACLSFYPGKNLGALGDGGAVLSTDGEVVRTVKSLRDHGATERYVHDELGWCSRLDGVQAAWLQVKLDHLGEWTASRRRLAERYRSLLPEGLLVGWEEGAVHHLLVARVPGADRARIRRELAGQGVQTGLHYPRALTQQAWLRSADRSCPRAEAAAPEVLSLPMDPLMEPGEVDAVVEALVSVLG